MRFALLVALVLLAGCLSSAGKPDGHYVYFKWNQTQKTCNNGSCSYGNNAESFSQTLECREQPTLSWDANSWVHGSVFARVLDDSGKEVASHTVSSDGKGSQAVTGKAGTWILAGATTNANGSMLVRLTCGNPVDGS